MDIVFLYFVVIAKLLAETRVICPLALVGQWADEITKMTTNIRVLKHQGTNRTTGLITSLCHVDLHSCTFVDAAALQKYHVVVTTYDTIKSEHAAYYPEAKDESSSKASSKKKVSAGSDSDDSDSDSAPARPAAKKGKGKAATKKCALFGVKWYRIVLGSFYLFVQWTT